MSESIILEVVGRVPVAKLWGHERIYRESLADGRKGEQGLGTSLSE